MKNDERKENNASQQPSLKQSNDGKLAYTVADCANLLSCSPGLIRKFIRQRRLPRIEGVRKILVPRAALEAFLM